MEEDHGPGHAFLQQEKFPNPTGTTLPNAISTLEPGLFDTIPPASITCETQVTGSGYNYYLVIFLILFLFRYIRVVVNTVAFVHNHPVPIPEKPSFSPADVTVVIATIDIAKPVVVECVRSILAHNISSLIISLGSAQAVDDIPAFVSLIKDCRVSFIEGMEPQRRQQVARAMPGVATRILVCCDDHCFWPFKAAFLPSLLAPFEDPRIGAVGTVLEARNYGYPTSFKGFWNFMGCTYLSRRAMEMLGTNNVDGGITCLTGRFAVFRAAIYKDPEFLKAYLNEYVFWGRVGPLNADDDKFHTRWLVNKGWDIKLQSGPETVMETTLGEYPRFLNQCLRWTRTTWRSNPRSLFTVRTIWHRQPWCVYSVFLYSFVRFALFYDLALGYLLWRGFADSVYLAYYLAAFLVWTFAAKMVKVIPYFKRYPKDLIYLPGYIIFCYWSSFVRLYALMTCWDTYWALGMPKKSQ